MTRLASVILPLPLPEAFDYAEPEGMGLDGRRPGHRAARPAAPLGRRRTLARRQRPQPAAQAGARAARGAADCRRDDAGLPELGGALRGRCARPAARHQPARRAGAKGQARAGDRGDRRGRRTDDAGARAGAGRRGRPADDAGRAGRGRRRLVRRDPRADRAGALETAARSSRRSTSIRRMRRAPAGG